MMTVPNPHPPHFPTLATQLQGPLGTFLEHRVLPAWIRERRWFRSKSRTLRTVALEAVFPCDATGAGDAVFAIARVTFEPAPPARPANAADDGPPRQDDHAAHAERYLLPLALVADATPRNEGPEPEAPVEQPERARQTQTGTPFPDGVVLGPVMTPAGTRLLIDGCWHEGFRTALQALLSGHETLEGLGGDMRGHPLHAPRLPGAPAASGQASGTAALRAAQSASRVLSAEQSNTSLVYGQGDEAVFVKLYRRIEEGVHPEPEMLRALSGHTTFRNAPGFLSSLRWTDRDGRAFTVALAQEFWENAGDAWTFTLAGLKDMKDMKDMKRGTGDRNGGDDQAPRDRRAARHGLPDTLRQTAALLGERVAAFHQATASVPEEGFAPRAFTRDDVREAGDRARASLAAGLHDLERRLAGLQSAGDHEADGPDEAFPVADARALLAERARLEARIDHAVQTFESTAGAGLKIRTHGDLHLGQILILRRADGSRDAGLLDFEGEPGRPLAAARRLQSPLRDVAGMLRSFHYAAHATARSGDAGASFDPEAASGALQEAFLDRYFSTLDDRMPPAPDRDARPSVLPAAAPTRHALLDVFLLEKAAYELAYECDNRPAWAGIPIRGLLSLSQGPTPPAPSA